MKYKVGDVVLMKVKIRSVDENDKVMPYEIDLGGGFSGWICGSRVFALVKRAKKAKAEADPAPETVAEKPAKPWHPASELPTSFESVRVLLPTGEEPGGFYSPADNAWKWGGGRNANRYPGAKIESILAWREMEK